MKVELLKRFDHTLGTAIRRYARESVSLLYRLLG